MPRTRRVDRPIAKKLSLRTSIVNEVNSQLADPLTGQPPYGAWTDVVESLLQQWLAGDVIVPRYPVSTPDLSDLTGEDNETQDSTTNTP